MGIQSQFPEKKLSQVLIAIFRYYVNISLDFLL